MNDTFRQLTNVDRLIHQPARFAILTVLSGCDSADFTFLHRITGLTRGNLSGHLTKLEEAALVQVDKSFVGKVPRTSISLTTIGRKAIEGHWNQLEDLRRQAKKWSSAHIEQ